MASASSSAASAAFGLGRRKKNPGLLDQIGKFFGGDKKKKGKGSFRGALSPAPQKASATSPRKRGGENAVVHFFRTMVSPAPPKSRVSLLPFAQRLKENIYKIPYMNKSDHILKVSPGLIARSEF
uniref:Myelin basic protein n=2 Tax=Oryzias TaxID=8089 RepID=A0A3P9IBE6_ORYLA